MLAQLWEEMTLNIKSCEKKENNTAELLVEVDAEEFDSAIEEAFRKNRNRISVPGFRKGKASRKMIERVYGASIFHSDAFEVLAPDVADYAVKESDLKIVGYPQVSDVDIDEEAGGVAFTIIASLYPEFTLQEYKGLTAPKASVEATDGEIDKEIATVQQQNARIEKVNRAAENGDVAIIDFEGFVEGESFEGGKDENYELELGSGSFIPGFEDGMIGMSAGDTRDIDLTFPENYAEHLAGKDVVFKVKLHELKEKQLPDLDDEFAKDVSEFDTFIEYRESIKQKILLKKQADADAAFEDALMDKIVEAMDVQLPDVMVEEQMDVSMQSFARQASAYGMDPSTYLQLMNTTPAAFRENMRASSEKQVKAMLALERIAELEGVEVNADDIEDEYKEAAARFGMEVEKLKENVEETRISTDIRLRRAAKIIADNAIATEEEPEKPEDDIGEKKTAKPTAKTRKPSVRKSALEAEPKETAETDEVSADGAENDKTVAEINGDIDKTGDDMSVSEDDSVDVKEPAEAKSTKTTKKKGD